MRTRWMADVFARPAATGRPLKVGEWRFTPVSWGLIAKRLPNWPARAMKPVQTARESYDPLNA